MPWGCLQVHPMLASLALLIHLPKPCVGVPAVTAHDERDLFNFGNPALAIQPPAILHHQLGLVVLAVVASVAHGWMYA